VYEAVLAYIRNTPFTQLVSYHAAYLDTSQLESFLQQLCAPPSTSNDPLLLEKSIIAGKNWTTVDDISFYLSLTSEYRPRLVALLLSTDSEKADFKQRFQQLISAHFTPHALASEAISKDREEHWALRRHLFQGKGESAGFLSKQQCRMVLLETAILHLRLVVRTPNHYVICECIVH
jgi:hypothetical protein